MENEIKENINEVIPLMSKCYSIQTVDMVNKIKAKSIPKAFSKKIHTHKYFKKILFNGIKIIKQNFIRYL